MANRIFKTGDVICNNGEFGIVTEHWINGSNFTVVYRFIGATCVYKKETTTTIFDVDGNRVVRLASPDEVVKIRQRIGKITL